MNTFIIDICTYDARKMFHRLKKLVSTVNIQEPAMYINANECCQVIVDTTKSEDELDGWLYTNNFDYIGVVSRGENE